MGGGARWSGKSERGSVTSLAEDSLDRSLAQGVNPNLIYLVDLPGFELVDMSAGVVGDADRALLKAAVAGAWRVAWKGPRTPPPRHPPVRRGDLPAVGDGAPIKRRGVGG